VTDISLNTDWPDRSRTDYTVLISKSSFLFFADHSVPMFASLRLHERPYPAEPVSTAPELHGGNAAIDMDGGSRESDSGVLALERAILPTQRWRNIAKRNLFLADMTRVGTSTFTSLLV
jgi:hypothetical protein